MMEKIINQLKTAELSVDREVIAAYAELTGDFNPIHLDAEFAAKTPMGGVIAHGTMSVGLIWQALEMSLGRDMLPNVTLDIRFIKPVRLGDRLQAGGQRQEGSAQTYDVWVKELGDNEPRIVGTAIVAK